MSVTSEFEVKKYLILMSLQYRVVNNVVFSYFFTFGMRM